MRVAWETQRKWEWHRGQRVGKGWPQAAVLGAGGTPSIHCGVERVVGELMGAGSMRGTLEVQSGNTVGEHGVARVSTSMWAALQGCWLSHGYPVWPSPPLCIHSHGQGPSLSCVPFRECVGVQCRILSTCSTISPFPCLASLPLSTLPSLLLPLSLSSFSQGRTVLQEQAGQGGSGVPTVVVQCVCLSAGLHGILLRTLIWRCIALESSVLQGMFVCFDKRGWLVCRNSGDTEGCRESVRK
jgi:hypothetical protein